MAAVLGSVLVEILGDPDPFAGEFVDAVEAAGGAASGELVDAMDAAVDDVGDVMGEGGQAAGGELVEGIESGVDELNIDLDGAFDDVVDEAAGAADDASEALDDIEFVIDASGAFDDLVAEAEAAGGEIADVMGAAGEEAVASLTGSLGSLQGALGTAAGGAGMEAFARSQQDLTGGVLRLAAATGMSERQVRGLATGLSDATFPLDEVIGLMETGRRRGLDSADALTGYASFWDMVGDATGESSQQLAEAGIALERLGISAGSEGEALAAFGFITQETTAEVSEFLRFTGRVGQELGDQTPSVDELAAAIGALEARGLDARLAQRQLQQALRETDGDMHAALATLGVGQDEFATFTARVGESGDVIERNADIFARTRTPIQRLTAGLRDLGFRFSGVSEAAGLLAAPLGAIGPSMLALNQTQQVLASGMGTSLVAGLKSAAGGFRVLTAAMLANPLFLIATVVIAVIAVFWRFRHEILDALGAAFGWLGDQIGRFVGWFVETIPGAIGTAIRWLGEFPQRVLRAMAALGGRVLRWLWDHAPPNVLMRAVREFGPRLLGWFRDLPRQVLAGLRDLAFGVLRFVERYHPGMVLLRVARQVGPRIVDWFRDLPGRLMEPILTLPQRMWEAGRNMIQSLIDGATSLLRRIGEFFLQVVPSWIRGPLERALGIASPSAVGMDIGQNLIGSIALGVRDAQTLLDRAVDESLGTLGQLDAVRPTGPVGTRGGDAPGVGGGRPIEIHVHGSGDPVRSARRAVRELRDVVYLDEPMRDA